MTRTKGIRAPIARHTLKIPESIVKMALKVQLPDNVQDSFTARVGQVVIEWYEGRGRKTRRRAEPEPESDTDPTTETEE